MDVCTLYCFPLSCEQDPNKQVVRVYSVPANTFESDEEDGDDEEDEDDDDDEQDQYDQDQKS